MYVPQCVTDITSDQLCHCLFYYAHHRDMDAPQYVHNVLSYSSVAWMFY
jgi:hypothetical protein